VLVGCRAFGSGGATPFIDEVLRCHARADFAVGECRTKGWTGRGLSILFLRQRSQICAHGRRRRRRTSMHRIPRGSGAGGAIVSPRSALILCSGRKATGRRVRMIKRLRVRASPEARRSPAASTMTEMFGSSPDLGLIKQEVQERPYGGVLRRAAFGGLKTGAFSIMTNASANAPARWSGSRLKAGARCNLPGNFAVESLY
jgi:hypothetical protein